MLAGAGEHEVAKVSLARLARVHASLMDDKHVPCLGHSGEWTRAIDRADARLYLAKEPGDGARRPEQAGARRAVVATRPRLTARPPGIAA